MKALACAVVSFATLFSVDIAGAADTKAPAAAPAAPAAAPNAPPAAPAAKPAATPTPAAQPAAAPPAASTDKAADPGAWSAEVAPNKGTTGISLDERQTEVVKTVSTYFSELKGLKGLFVQTGADNKRMKGKFFVKRPGRFRFDYSLPSKLIIVSDGDNLAVQDLDLNTDDRVEVDQTPFRLLLRKDVDLLRDARIMEVQQSEDLIILAIQDKSPDTPGRIKLFLATKPSLELKEWVTTDPQGLDTRIEVSELIKSNELDESLFKIQMVGRKPGLQ